MPVEIVMCSIGPASEAIGQDERVMNTMSTDATLIKVVDLRSGREIAWGGGMTERLRDRFDDIQWAVADGVRAVSAGLRDMATIDGWEICEISASFGVALAAEAGVVLTKASGEATFDVSVTFRRADD